MFNKITYLLTYLHRAPATGKARSPRVRRCVEGNRREAPEAERSRCGSGCRPPSVKSLDAHSGARPRAGSGVVRIDTGQMS